MRPDRERQLSDFAGTWRIERLIDHADGTRATFTGSAVFEPGDGMLIYRETGFLTIAGQAPVRAERTYLWHPDLSVEFSDGCFFHQIPALGGDASHWCDPDRYDVSYDFAAWPAWRATWRVHGPRKDYRMVSDYAPAP